MRKYVKSPWTIFFCANYALCRSLESSFVATFAHILRRSSLLLERCYSNPFRPSTKHLCLYHAYLSVLSDFYFSLLFYQVLSLLNLPISSTALPSCSTLWLSLRLFIGLVVSYCYVLVVSCLFLRRPNSLCFTAPRETLPNTPNRCTPRPNP